jgi:hypothetical protein
VWRDPFKQAAMAYAAYGLVYFVAAIFELTPDRMRSFHGVPWWSFYAIGLIFLAVLPYLVWHRYVLLTRLLALGPAGKALALCWRQSRRLAALESTPTYEWTFAVVAVGAAVLLWRAGFSRPLASRARSPVRAA